MDVCVQVSGTRVWGLGFCGLRCGDAGFCAGVKSAPRRLCSLLSWRMLRARHVAHSRQGALLINLTVCSSADIVEDAIRQCRAEVRPAAQIGTKMLLLTFCTKVRTGRQISLAILQVLEFVPRQTELADYVPPSCFTNEHRCSSALEATGAFKNPQTLNRNRSGVCRSLRGPGSKGICHSLSLSPGSALPSARNHCCFT